MKKRNRGMEERGIDNRGMEKKRGIEQRGMKKKRNKEQK